MNLAFDHARAEYLESVGRPCDRCKGWRDREIVLPEPRYRLSQVELAEEFRKAKVLCRDCRSPAPESRSGVAVDAPSVARNHETEPAGEAASPAESSRGILPGAAAVTAYLSTLSPNSRRGMSDALAVLAKLLGHESPEAVAWHQLRYADTTALQAKLVATDRNPDYCRKVITGLRSVLKASKLLDLMTVEQFDRATSLERIRGSRVRRVKNLKPGDVAALLAATRDDPKPLRGLRDRALLGLLDGGGLRRAEAASLLVSALNRETRRLLVIGKGNKERPVPLPLHATTWIGDFIDARRASSADPILCPVSQRGEAVNRRLAGGQAVYVVLARLFDRAGVAGSPPHAFRRGFITALLRKGVDIKTVKEIVGHASIETTDGYDQRTIEDFAPAVDRLPDPEVRA